MSIKRNKKMVLKSRRVSDVGMETLHSQDNNLFGSVQKVEREFVLPETSSNEAKWESAWEKLEADLYALDLIGSVKG